MKGEKIRGIFIYTLFKIGSIRKAILISSALFGIIHIIPWLVVNAFLGGIFLGWIYWRYKTIWLCMFIHAFHNTLVWLMPFPSAAYGSILRNPIWFDILGLLLFGLGLLMVIALSPKKK